MHNKQTGVSVLFLLAVTVVGQALTPSSYFSTVDQARLRSVFEAAQPYSDLANAYYSIMGLQLLGSPVPRAQETCSFVKSKLDSQNLESIFLASSTSTSLSGCQLSLGGVQTFLEDSIKNDAPVVNIYYAVMSMQNLGLKVDSDKVSKTLLAALKTDDTAQSHGYAFLAASTLSGDLTKFHDLIEDIIAQADEVDEKYLQFESGLFTTALVIDGAYKLAEKANKAPTLTSEKVIKFTNYFLSRKHVQQLKSASRVLSVIKTLTSNKFHIPIAVTLASQVSISQASPVVQVRVTNVLGGELGQLTVSAESARHIETDAVVLSKKQFSAKDSTLYELDFMQAKPARGFYKLTINAAPQKADSRLIGIAGAEVGVKVVTQVSVENVEIGVSDRDQSMPSKMTKLQHPNKAAVLLEADSHQKFVVKFQLKDKSTGSAIEVHQAFVRLTNQNSQQEIAFVAETDSSTTYKFDLNVFDKAKDFAYLSGVYTVDLIIGDAVIENPFTWTIADVDLKFQESATAKKDSVGRYSKKPEIKHMFREPEKRPPTVVSTVFTGLVLLPAIILLVLWMKIGVNVSNFSFNLSTLGFHLGLGAIFVLYVFYWMQLDMFSTLRYLGLLGIPTFLFGNKLLSGIAAKRK